MLGWCRTVWGLLYQGEFWQHCKTKDMATAIDFNHAECLESGYLHMKTTCSLMCFPIWHQKLAPCNAKYWASSVLVLWSKSRLFVYKTGTKPRSIKWGERERRGGIITGTGWLEKAGKLGKIEEQQSRRCDLRAAGSVSSQCILKWPQLSNIKRSHVSSL